MKARKKGTNDPFEEIDCLQFKDSYVLYKADMVEFENESKGNESDVEYWEQLRHQAAIAAMQGIMNFFGSIDYNRDTIARLAVEQAETLAWLEKQKEYELPEDLGDYIAELNKQFPEVSFAKLSRIAVRVKNWLKKQSEQKPTDKVEPKFQNGQWIVWQNKCYKVNYNGCGYELIDQNGLSTSLEYGTVDKSAHLWTIQDAKDGDVLQLGVVTVIFQEYICNGNCKCYYSVCNGEFEIPTKDESYGTFNATPATKEQRDLLFSKMRESGYEFDFEKKELKKLSQRMISAEAKEALYDKPTDEEMKELLRTEYEKGRADTIAEMGKEWSEEDERILQCLIQNQEEALDDVRNNKYGHSEIISDLKEMYRERIDWLKSLKNKVQPQPKHEWSEEDEKKIDKAIWLIEHDASHGWIRELREDVISGLKSLKQKIKL